MCEKGRKEGTNVYVSSSGRATIRASQLLISWGCERKLSIIVTEKICSGCPCIPKTSPAACFVLPRFDSCLAEVLALLGTSNSLLINLKKMTAETQKCTVLSCTVFVITKSIQFDFSYFFLSRDLGKKQKSFHKVWYLSFNSH